MKRGHLSWTPPSAEPPPSLFADELPAGAKKKKKKKKLLAAAPSSAAPSSEAPKKRKQQPPPAAAPSAEPPKRKRADGAGAGAAPAPATSAAGACGLDASHLLLLGPLPHVLDEHALRLRFARAAPLQLTMLGDWGDSRRPGNACLALSSARAVELAHRAAAAGLAGGAIRVLDAGEADAGPDAFGSPPMQALLRELAAEAATFAGPLTREARHVLRCCERAAARDAIDEFRSVCASGKPKAPAALLLSTLLRRRQGAGAGLVWLGRATGLPLPAEPAARLHRLMAACDWAAMPADGKLRGPMADFSFKLGLSTRAGPPSGPYSPFAFKPATGVWDAASVARKHRALWEAASELATAIDPAFHWTTVAFNRNFKGDGSSRHRDEKDAGPQLAAAFGEFEGGELRVHGQAGAMDVDTRGRYVRFDGRYEHEVLPYRGGDRYSVVFFSLAPPWAVDPASTEEGVGA